MDLFRDDSTENYLSRLRDAGEDAAPVRMLPDMMEVAWKGRVRPVDVDFIVPFEGDGGLFRTYVSGPCRGVEGEVDCGRLIIRLRLDEGTAEDELLGRFERRYEDIRTHMDSINKVAQKFI